MLVLSRKAEQEIVIGDCRIKVLSIQGGRVRLGIEAAPHIPVYRSELLDTEMCGAPSASKTEPHEHR
ncbi:MAG TPA: carbon storage regulator [Planctomycetaceae bacterium]|jgi:carbon storage regulator|nr:carbon storage regulator [Planctomycetaceae bacterium]